MVASAPQSSSKLPQPSYADRAKNAKVPNQPPSLPSNGVMTTAGVSANLAGSSRSALDTSIIKTSSQPSTDAKANPGPSIVQERRQSRSSSPHLSTDGISTHGANGFIAANSLLQTNTANRPAPSIKPPPINVWQVRKEQMAQANAQSRLPLLSNTQNHPNSPSGSDSKAMGVIVAKETATRPSHSANGVLPPSENDDPLAIHSRTSPLLPMNDKDSWPEVGSSSQSVDSQNGKESRDGSEKMEREKSGKGEKPKWVQIPPSELQATADALQARSQPAHSRNQSQHGRYNNTRNQTTSTGGSSSGSVVVSRRSSRAQSVHSRTGSVQASPRHFPRPKLPAETDTSAENRSGANSPAPSMNFRSPYSDAPGINYSSGQASGYDIFPLIPEQQIRPHSFERTESPSQSTYYSGVNTNTSRPTTESPTAPQDHLVGSTNHADPYFYGNKYTHWTGSSTSHHLDRNKQMQSTLQTSNPSNAKDGHIPPPMTSRSPPHEEALGGYPDVASALSSAEDAGGVNGGGIVRNMVFGSIEPQGSCQESRSTTPEPKATTLVSNEDAVVVEQKAFPAFSIGILPNEVERARTRSKARKQGNTRSSSATAEVNGGNLEPPGPVIDSTESKWEFGTTKHLDADTLSSSPGNGTNDPVASCPPASKTAVALDRRRSEGGDEWEVRDFGYGFGSMSGTGRAPAVVREERLAREKQRERERQERERERELERDRDRESENYFELGRPRRGSLVGIPDRGGSVPRRGRGNFGSRNFSRGYHGHPRQPLPFTATPPQHFQQLSSHGYSPEPQNAAYYVPQPNFTPYGVGYDVYAYAPYHQAPAVAAPLSSVAFPLDPTRYYLLCQLEYYLSPQNMAQDFFLRQQMDPHGWISIPLLASFNRVKQVTMDVQLVHEVLTLSTLVEVSGDWVRMGGQQWKQFILPNTAPSENEQSSEHMEEEVQLDEDEEEEVEFVMG